MQTVKVFKLGNAQAVRIPKRFQFEAAEVEVFQRGEDLVLRPRAETAADVFARIRRKHGEVDVKRPAQGTVESVKSLDV